MAGNRNKGDSSAFANGELFLGNGCSTQRYGVGITGGDVSISINIYYANRIGFKFESSAQADKNKNNTDKNNQQTDGQDTLGDEKYRYGPPEADKKIEPGCLTSLGSCTDDYG